MPRRRQGRNARGPTPRARPSASRKGQPLPQPGRRPSSPGFLFLVALMWIVCGIVALAGLHASWKLIPGIVFIGIGLFFLRGAAATVVRHEEGHDR